MHPTIALSLALLQKASITPNDENCQDIIAEHLAKIGFDNEFMYFGEGSTGQNAQVKNLWSKRGTDLPVVCFWGIPMLCQWAMRVYGGLSLLSQLLIKVFCMGVVRRI